MKTVFFYGLFMDLDILTAQGYQPTDFQIAELKNYRLKLGARATLIPDIASDTWGSIMNLSETQIEQLYSTASVSDYRPVKITCIVENDLEVSGEVYILPPDYPLQPPGDANYAKELLAIAKKISLPISYQNEIIHIIKKIEDQ